MLLPGFLIVFPLVVALLLFCVRADKARDVLVIAGALVTAAASLYMVAANLGASYTPIQFSSHAVDYLCTAVGVGISGIVLYFAVRFKNAFAGVLAVVQLVVSLVLEFGFAHGLEVPNGLYFDSLTIFMVFIIGVIGSGICVYALGYMKDFQAHQPKDAKDRRPFFFGLMFLFLSAMYVIVFSNNMIWLFTGWEITTVCSFLLIGYTRTEEALNNAFRQIIMNIAGGIAFALGLIASASQLGTLDLSVFLSAGAAKPAVAVIAVTCLAFAGLTKAAQMPFHTWLLGAMVAPTPTSALLHSSTMVKAGVFLLVKLAPVLAVCVVPKTMVILVGGLTFLLCSLLAISQSNAKRVLAYSTIANLGLITACAGVGSAEAVWAAAFLILFHAIAKSLLFLCVGTAEHHIGSRNIEDMDLLFERMPKLARFMVVGIMCMFIAPFGMLLAKWASLVSFVDGGHIVLIMLLAFGSAATFMFWAKWMGKLSGIAATPQNDELTVHKSEWGAIVTMVLLVFVGCIGLPVISNALVEPYLLGVFGADLQTISDDNLWISAFLSAVVIFVLLVGLERKARSRRVGVYLSGVTVNSDQRQFVNSMSGVSTATARNWYMEQAFGEEKLTTPSHVITTVIIVAAFAAAVVLTIL